nr:hypothetical protein Iba_chr12fCG16400 [Ipomoea batatas]
MLGGALDGDGDGGGATTSAVVQGSRESGAIEDEEQKQTNNVKPEMKGSEYKHLKCNAFQSNEEREKGYGLRPCIIDDDARREEPPEFPPESFWLSKDADLD